MPDILCLGEPLIEFNHLGGTEWRQGFGGDVSNVAVAAARQGASVGMMTRLGRDSFGSMLMDLWHAEGVDTALVRHDDNAETAHYFVTHDAKGHKFEYRRKGSAASQMAPHALPKLPSGARILHYSGITQAISATARAAAQAATDAALQAGLSVSFDPNLRLALWPISVARPAILHALGTCHIALPGLDDARILLDMEDAEGIVHKIRSMGPSIVALTMGRDGVLLGTDAGITQIPTPAVAAIDATGAGDCFDGAFLARLVAGDAPDLAARYAAHAAALSTTGHGAVTPIPHAQTVRDAMARQG